MGLRRSLFVRKMYRDRDSVDKKATERDGSSEE